MSQFFNRNEDKAAAHLLEYIKSVKSMHVGTLGLKFVGRLLISKTTWTFYGDMQSCNYKTESKSVRSGHCGEM